MDTQHVSNDSTMRNGSPNGHVRCTLASQTQVLVCKRSAPCHYGISRPSRACGNGRRLCNFFIPKRVNIYTPKPIVRVSSVRGIDHNDLWGFGGGGGSWVVVFWHCLELQRKRLMSFSLWRNYTPPEKVCNSSSCWNCIINQVDQRTYYSIAKNYSLISAIFAINIV